MKTTHIFYAFCASILFSCSTKPRACIEPSSYETRSEYGIVFDNCSEHASSYEWDFGDGSTSSDFSPAHSYNQSGTYTVTLRAYNEDGTIYDVETQEIKVESISTHYLGTYNADDQYDESTINGPFENQIFYETQFMLKGEESVYISKLNGYVNISADVVDTNNFSIPLQTVFEDAAKNIIHKIQGSGTFNEGNVYIDYNVIEYKGINLYENSDFIHGELRATPKQIN